MARRPRGTGWASQAWAVFDSLTLRTGGYSVSGLTATLTTSSAHGVTAGMGMFIAFTGATPPLSGFYTVVSTPTPTSLTIAVTSGSGVGTFSSNILVKDSFNMTSVSKVSTGDILFSFEKPFASASYGMSGSFHRATAAGFFSLETIPFNTGAVSVKMFSFSGVAVDSSHAMIHFFGRQ